MSNTPKLSVQRLVYLSKMLSKYSHRWNPGNSEPSRRMYDWVDEYNDARNTPVWKEYCESHGFTLDHDAYDCLA